MQLAFFYLVYIEDIFPIKYLFFLKAVKNSTVKSVIIYLTSPTWMGIDYFESFAMTKNVAMEYHLSLCNLS